MRKMFSKNQIEKMIQETGKSLYLYKIASTFKDTSDHLYDGSVILAITDNPNLEILSEGAELSSVCYFLQVELGDDDHTYYPLSPELTMENDNVYAIRDDGEFVNIALDSIQYDEITQRFPN